VQRIVVGVDGSTEAATAEAWAARLAHRLGAALTIATVWSPTDQEAPADQVARERATTTELLDGPWSAPAREIGVAFSTRVLDGDTPDALLDAADRMGASLVVIGTRGTDRLGLLRRGSFSDWSAHRAVRPLAVVPAWTRTTIDRIVLGVDGTHDQDWGVDFAATLATAFEIEIVTLYVQPPPSRWRRHPDRQQTARDDMVRWCLPLTEAGITVSPRVVESSHPAEALLSAATEVDADLILIGTRALGGRRLLRLGGVTMDLLHRSDRPVIVVPPPA
jgi:nucleotide-binding universal stress UspA family protein